MSIITKINCFMGFHDTTSYSQELNYDGPEMIRVGKKLSGDAPKAFLELCAVRCKKCGYSRYASNANDFSVLEQ